MGACGAYPGDPMQYWVNFRFIDGVVCVFGDQIGVGVTMLLFFGITFLNLYKASGSVMLPVGVMILLAPLVVVLLPAIGTNFAIIIVLISLSLAGLYLYLKLDER